MLTQKDAGPVRGRWILATATLASSMAFLAGSAVSVALPTIQRAFGADISGIQWVTNAYLLALASLLCVSGSLGDRFGRKKIFTLGIILFMSGTALSGVTANTGQLVFFQGFQGVGAAMMVPGSLAIINVTVPEERRGRAIGLWAGLSGGIAALGPFLGGWLTQTAGWRWVFFINVPIGLAALVMALKFVPENKNPEAPRLDWAGTTLFVLSLSGTSFGLLRAPLAGWSSPIVLACLIGGLSAFILFIAIESRQAHPIVPLSIFRNPLVAGANMVTLALYFAFNGTLFYLVLNLQQIQGYSPAAAGAGLLPPIILITFLAGPSGSLSDRIGPRRQMIAGPAIVGAGMVLISLPGAVANYFSFFLPGLVLFGLGMAMVIPALTKSALAVRPELSGAASGVNNAASRLAGLLAVAVLGAIMIGLFSARLQANVTASALTPEQQSQIIQQSDKLGGIEIPATFSEPAAAVARKAINDSFIFGFRRAMLVNAALAFIGSFIAAATIRGPLHLKPR
jgi:EmrB/QacA subfamily drug resistance transporter